MQTNQPRAHTPSHLLYLVFTLQEATALYPDHPRARNQITGDSPLHPKMFQLADPKPDQLLALPRPFLLEETTVKTWALCLLLTSSPPNCPRCFPGWPCVAWQASFSWKLWVTNYLFNGNILLSSPYLSL